jgi:hypothetical protein
MLHAKRVHLCSVSLFRVMCLCSGESANFVLQIRTFDSELFVAPAMPDEYAAFCLSKLMLELTATTVKDRVGSVAIGIFSSSPRVTMRTRSMKCERSFAGVVRQEFHCLPGY